MPAWRPWKLDQQALFKLQNEYVNQATALIGQFAAGKPPALSDRRFSGKAWHEQPQFGWQAAWYLLNADYLQKTAELIDADQKTRDRIRFLTQQWIDACSPANFLASNPGRAGQADGDRRREPAQRHRQPARRHAARDGSRRPT